MSTLMSRDLNIGNISLFSLVPLPSLTNLFPERSSTRLHAPPGGKSSICFGDSSAPSTSYPTNKSKDTYVPNQSYAPQKKNNQVSMSDLLSQSEEETEEEKRKRLAKRTNNSNSNQMTDAMNYENTKPRSSTRVRQAPGGTSSLVLG
jgi:hypothetical protein